MKNNKRHSESSTELMTLTPDTLRVAYKKSVSDTYTYTVSDLLALKAKEETSKIGRRYSFDDNGGGYEGL